jgi:hypothetical protein
MNVYTEQTVKEIIERHEYLQRKIYTCKDVALSKYVIHYGPRSSFSYYDLTTPYLEETE